MTTAIRATSAFPPATLAWTVWGLGACLYLLAFYQRNAPAVMTSELSQAFSLTAASLGGLSASYFYAYVAVQIPTGVLADRWGPRRLLTLGALGAAVGMFVFGWAGEAKLASIGRALVGGSVGVAYVAMLKLASVWLPVQRFTLAAAMALVVGTAGATLAGTPLRIAVGVFGWREVMIASSVLGVLLAVATWFIVRDDPSERGFRGYAPSATSHQAAHSFWHDIREVLSYKNTWLLLIAPGAVTSILLAFAGLWGVPFLVEHHGFSKAQAAAVTPLVMIGWAVGGVWLGPQSDRMGARKPLYIASVLGVMTIWALLIFVPQPPGWMIVLLCFLLGFAGGAFIIGFAWAKESVPAHLAGTSGGFANVGSMAGPMLGQPLVGWALDARWNGQMQNGVRYYDLTTFQFAFALLLLWGVLALCLLVFANETHCKQRP